MVLGRFNTPILDLRSPFFLVKTVAKLVCENTLFIHEMLPDNHEIRLIFKEKASQNTLFTKFI